jgi:hypothetical protein
MNKIINEVIKNNIYNFYESSKNHTFKMNLNVYINKRD